MASGPARASRSPDAGARAVAGSSGARTALWILATIAVVLFLREAQALLVPIALAALISYALHPLVVWLERWRVPRVLGAGLVVASLVGLGLWAVFSLRDDFITAAERLPRQVRELRQEWESSRGGMIQRLRDAAQEVQQATRPGRQPGELSPEVAAPPAARDSGSGLGQMLWRGSSNLIYLAGQVVVIVFLTYFLLLSARAWRERIIRVAGHSLSTRRTAAEVLDEISSQVRRFLVARAATGVVVGVATWLALLWFGAPNPGLWGTAAGVLNSIPYFGPVIVSAGLAAVGLFAGGLTMALQLAGVALVITSLEGWVLTPPLLGRAARLNTLAVFLGLLVWSWVWGVWGTILAVPLLSLIKAVCDHVEPLERVAELLEE